MRQRLGIAGVADPQPAAAAARRAGDRARPGGHARHARAHPPARRASGITVLLSSHLMNEVEELCNRVAIIRAGPIVYEGALDELLATRRRQLPPADARRRRGRARSASQPRYRRTSSPTATSCASRPTRTPSRRSPSRSARRASAILQLVDRRGVASRSSSSAHRRRVERPRPARGGGRVMTRASPGSTAGSCEAPRAEAHLPRPRRGDDRAGHLRRRAPVQTGGPNDVPFGRYVRDSGLATPLVLLLFGSIWLFPLITALVAGDIVASETPQRNAQDDPHALARARPGVRRQGARGAHVRARDRRRDGRRRRRRRLRSRGASTRSRRSPARPSRAGRGLGLLFASLARLRAAARRRSPPSGCCSRRSRATQRGVGRRRRSCSRCSCS